MDKRGNIACVLVCQPVVYCPTKSVIVIFPKKPTTERNTLQLLKSHSLRTIKRSARQLQLCGQTKKRSGAGASTPSSRPEQEGRQAGRQSFRFLSLDQVAERPVTGSGQPLYSSAPRRFLSPAAHSACQRHMTAHDITPNEKRVRNYT